MIPRVILTLTACGLLFARPGNVTGVDALLAAVLFILLAADMAEMDDA